jgi:hypothetical protein
MKMMRASRIHHFSNRSRGRRVMPKEIAIELIRTLDLSPDERRFVEQVSGQWVGANDVLAVAAGPREPVGELLISAGRLTRAQLDQALADQSRSGERLGEVLVRNGWLTASEVRLVLAFQKRLGRTGDAHAGPLQLGNLLVATRAITPEQLQDALQRQQQSKRRLGDTLVGAGYVSEPQIARGLRLQRMLLHLALAVLLSTSLAPATSGAAASAYSAIAFSATVLPYHRLDVVRQASTLTVTPEDVARGYVDVPAGTQLRAQSNECKGFSVVFDPRARLFERATITGLGNAVEIGPDGGAVNQAYSGRETLLQLSYRFYLAAGLVAGSYPWPLQISSSVVY